MGDLNKHFSENVISFRSSHCLGNHRLIQYRPFPVLKHILHDNETDYQFNNWNYQWAMSNQFDRPVNFFYYHHQTKFIHISFIIIIGIEQLATKKVIVIVYFQHIKYAEWHFWMNGDYYFPQNDRSSIIIDFDYEFACIKINVNGIIASEWCC